jgi:hypothetical protein
MSYRSHKANFILMILGALLLGMVSPAFAQEAMPVPVIYAQTDAGIAFYGLSPEKILETRGHLPDDFGADEHDIDWTIQSNFVISPDGQQLVYTVENYGDKEYNVGLFFYSLTTHTYTIRQIIHQSYGGYFYHLAWSPDGQFVLIEPIDPSGSGGEWPEVRVYDLVSDSIYKLTDSSRDIHGHLFTWASNNLNLVYSSDGMKILEIGLDGIRRQSLVNFEINPPANAFPSTCNFAWSEQRARWYYVVGCAWDDPLDSLYSVDLSGHARLEADIPDLLRQEFSLPPGYDPYVEDVSVTSIHAAEDTVYAALGFKAMVATGSNDPDSEVVNKAFCRVIRLDSPGKIETVFEVILPSQLGSEFSQAVFAPDNRKVALVDGQHIVIGDLMTGEQLVSLTRTLEVYYQRMDVLWINEHELLFAVNDDVWLLDTTDGTTTNLTANIEARAYILPQTSSY